MPSYEVGVFVDLRFAWHGFISERDKPLTCESELTKTPTVFRRRRKRWRRIADAVWNAIRRLVSGPSKSCYCPPACLFYHAAGENIVVFVFTHTAG